MSQATLSREETLAEIERSLAAIEGGPEDDQLSSVAIEERHKAVDLLRSIKTLLEAGRMPLEEANVSAVKIVTDYIHRLIEENKRLAEITAQKTVSA